MGPNCELDRSHNLACVGLWNKKKIFKNNKICSEPSKKTKEHKNTEDSVFDAKFAYNSQNTSLAS